MKTPREILLARHQAAEPKLDGIRRIAVEKLNNEAVALQGAAKLCRTSDYGGASVPASLLSKAHCCFPLPRGGEGLRVRGKMRKRLLRLMERKTFPSDFVALPISLLLCCAKTFWRELICPCRRTWAGLAAVWILIFAVNFSMRDYSGPAIARTPPSPEMMLALRQQEQLLSELIGPNDAPAAEPQKRYSPKPDSLRTFEILTT